MRGGGGARGNNNYNVHTQYRVKTKNSICENSFVMFVYGVGWVDGWVGGGGGGGGDIKNCLVFVGARFGGKGGRGGVISFRSCSIIL